MSFAVLRTTMETSDRRRIEGEMEMLAWADHAWGPWFLVFPLLWIGVVVLLILAIRGSWGRRAHDGSAESILGERFARGEITPEEYRERLTVLRGK
jgi:putative membrane protein